MRPPFAPGHASSPAPSSVHRVTPGRFGSAKTQSHRHERRRVRALLRDIGGLQEPDDLPLLRHG